MIGTFVCEAIRNYGRSLELNPDNTNAVEMLGSTGSRGKEGRPPSGHEKWRCDYAAYYPSNRERHI